MRRGCLGPSGLADENAPSTSPFGNRFTKNCLADGPRSLIPLGVERRNGEMASLDRAAWMSPGRVCCKWEFGA